MVSGMTDACLLIVCSDLVEDGFPMSLDHANVGNLEKLIVIKCFLSDNYRPRMI